MSIPVSVILERKGSDVVTIAADASLLDAARVLAEHNIGALVVSGDGRRVDGIVSERDVVCDLGSGGRSALDRSVADVMSSDLATCTPETTIDELMAMMTERRIRHLPVIVDDELAGIVSIGDVVRSRLDELEVQAEALEQYVTGSGP